MTVKRWVLDNLKNTLGWRTSERLVVLAVDDYGNVRLDSAAAGERLIAGGVKLQSRFDRFDALETKQDLELLLGVLSSVSDSRGRSAVLTPYSLCANPNFEAIADSGTNYCHESLPTTFERLAIRQPDAYEGAWELWRDGIRLGLLRPQFHGREHLNVELFERKLRRNDSKIMANISNRSVVALGEEPSMPGVGFTHAFGLWDRSEVGRHREIIEDGLRLFSDVFGFQSLTFTPPAQDLHPDLYPTLDSLGIRGIFKPRSCVRRIDKDQYVRETNFRIRNQKHAHLSLVRNVVFEPTIDSLHDSVELALGQIAAAFRWRKPAMISSHRVNFSGHIDASNRQKGIDALRRLLQTIVQRWPDVQFIGADELVSRIHPDHRD